MIGSFNKENIQWKKDDRGLPSCFYKIKVPSVSTIITEMLPDPEYEQWVLAMGKEKVEQIMNSAGQRGTSMHFFFLENFITKYSQSKDIAEALKYTQIESLRTLSSDNIPIDKIDEGRNLFYKFYYSAYIDQYFNLLAIELPVYSSSLFYRGKLDIFYKDKLFGLSITDFKSSNGKIKKGSTKELKYFYQLGAYSNCLREMYKEKKVIINKASILCIDKQSDILQEIILSGAELEKYEQKFSELVKEYHIKYSQEYLLT